MGRSGNRTTTIPLDRQRAPRSCGEWKSTTSETEETRPRHAIVPHWHNVTIADQRRRRPPPTNGTVGFLAVILSGLRRRLRDYGLTPGRPAVTFMILQPAGCKPTSSPTSLMKRTPPDSTIPKTGAERQWSVACSSNRTDQEQRSKPSILMTALGAWMDSTTSRPPPTPVCQQSPP